MYAELWWDSLLFVWDMAEGCNRRTAGLDCVREAAACLLNPLLSIAAGDKIGQAPIERFAREDWITVASVAGVVWLWEGGGGSQMHAAVGHVLSCHGVWCMFMCVSSLVRQTHMHNTGQRRCMLLCYLACRVLLSLSEHHQLVFINSVVHLRHCGASRCMQQLATPDTDCS